MSHFYEVALYGEFFAPDLKPILNRIAMHSESAVPMHQREVVFEPYDAQGQRESGNEPVLLRCRKELSEGQEGGWLMYSYLKPESVRQHPEATVRPWTTCQISGDALSFASALGYVQRTQLYKKGYQFRRDQLLIQMFQQEQIDSKTGKPVPAHVDTLWEVEVKTAFPVQTTQGTSLHQIINSVLEVQSLMKAAISRTSCLLSYDRRRPEESQPTLDSPFAQYI